MIRRPATSAIASLVQCGDSTRSTGGSPAFTRPFVVGIVGFGREVSVRGTAGMSLPA